jgi:tRNA (guanine37-N1)-methyltransferase
MRFDILTIFPDLLESPLKEGIIRRAIGDGKVEIHTHNIRDFAEGRHAMTDDRPFGGGEGMVMKPEPIAAALAHVESVAPGGSVVLLTPQGRTLDQAMAERFVQKDHLLLLCGRYEGVDERVRAGMVHEEVSIGDYILTGGELAAMVLVDAVTRLLPGVLGHPDSAARDTFSWGGLKYPQYTRPRVFQGQEVPEVLLTGDHAAIAEWRLVEAVSQTLDRRPELFEHIRFSPAEERILKRHGLLAVVGETGGKGRAES